MADWLPRYDPSQTYRWNYAHAPDPAAANRQAPAVPGDWDFCGRKVDSPLGVAAGPLLNGKWCLYYVALGFDVVTYKTVRSVQRECYPLPNLQPVDCGPLAGPETRVAPTETMRGSWAVSFGMPSSDPDTWRTDIEATRRQLDPAQVLSVSVVGTIRDGWSMDQLADDYALCARWAVDSGADVIETNFSCPNVSTCDGQLYHDAANSRLVAQRVRLAIDRTPLVIKIGHLTSIDDISLLLSAVGDLADGLVMTNSVATTVGTSDDELMFDRQPRGICGSAIRDASLLQVRRFADAIRGGGHDIQLIGVGGISSAADVQSYLDAGAGVVQLATAAMIHPELGLEIRKELVASAEWR